MEPLDAFLRTQSDPPTYAVSFGLPDGLGQSKTVPDLARQHIQTVMNGLLDEGLVRAVENPGHKRSVLYLLTPLGAETFAEIRRREAAPMVTLAGALSEPAMAAAANHLARMNEELKVRLDKGDDK